MRRATGEFVHDLVTRDLRGQMNRTSEAVLGEIDEFDLAGLERKRPPAW
ncbi:MAG: hypothetical protein K2X03_22025 [Bryobacteraceae bacterium]|nr:hypothetical protein [Bryobacteraceae bacterium]